MSQKQIAPYATNILIGQLCSRVQRADIPSNYAEQCAIVHYCRTYVAKLEAAQ